MMNLFSEPLTCSEKRFYPKNQIVSPFTKKGKKVQQISYNGSVWLSLFKQRPIFKRKENINLKNEIMGVPIISIRSKSKSTDNMLLANFKTTFLKYAPIIINKVY
nr:hypothetical protein [Trentepohlia sp. YN1317]